MKTPLQRIMECPLRADKQFVRVAADGYHVTTISDGMNDCEEYARLFSAAPALLAALRLLADEISDLRHRNAIHEGYGIQRIDGMVSLARTAITAAIEG
jgi:hypothetical protein